MAFDVNGFAKDLHGVCLRVGVGVKGVCTGCEPVRVSWVWGRVAQRYLEIKRILSIFVIFRFCSSKPVDLWHSSSIKPFQFDGRSTVVRRSSSNDRQMVRWIFRRSAHFVHIFALGCHTGPPFGPVRCAFVELYQTPFQRFENCRNLANLCRTAAEF